MGQSGYAETFTNIMLGWIRNLAGSIASMFQSTGGGAPGGMDFLNWFSEHWLGLVVFLIVLGVLVDWIVWLIRWRPYWLWFHKRRIVLDDDIDEELTERELRRRYDRDPDERPRFRSAVLRRGGADYEDGAGSGEWDDGYGDDYEEDYGDDYEGDYIGDYDDDEEAPDGYGVGDEDAYGPEYDQGEDEDGQDGWNELYEERPPEDDGEGDDWDDVPRKPRERKRPLLFQARRAKQADEDPFAVDEDEFASLDDDFYAVVSEAPQYAPDSASWTGAEPDGEPAPPKLVPLPDADGGGDYDERIGYRSSYEPMTGTQLSRKSRRRRA